jgi:hypothetical protein
MVAKFANFTSFSFPADPSGPVSLIRSDFPLQPALWCSFSAPRGAPAGDLHIIDISATPASDYDFSFIGVTARPFSALADLPGGSTVLVWHSSRQQTAPELVSAAEAALRAGVRLLINAAALRAIGDLPLPLEFADDFGDEIDWSCPPPDFRPGMESLPRLTAASGVDRWFGSVPCRARAASGATAIVEMGSSGRLFAGRFGDVGVFNFELEAGPEGDVLDLDLGLDFGLVEWACRKQKLLCIGWLLGNM